MGCKRRRKGDLDSKFPLEVYRSIMFTPLQADNSCVLVAMSAFAPGKHSMESGVLFKVQWSASVFGVLLSPCPNFVFLDTVCATIFLRLFP